MLALKRLKKVALAAAAAAMVFTFYADSASKSEATVDTGSDPLVTLSYVNEVLKPQITNEIISQVNAIIAVSYTHLDVYKRQIYW